VNRRVSAEAPSASRAADPLRASPSRRQMPWESTALTMRSVDGVASRDCSGFVDDGTGAAQRVAGIDDAGGDIEPCGGPAAI
jgi:hypothetical protein